MSAIQMISMYVCYGNDINVCLGNFRSICTLKEIPSDTEDSLTLEFEQDVLPPSPRVNAHSKSGYENIEDLFELDDSLYFDQQFEIKLKEEDESDVACF
ncbi:uncharacterized protein A4U43_C01F20350 [Asparagus officinalis]|uniref:Uncharacterized protein n=1 Tax=Asparagus officinalis TaxID=4686 RepID=A0A5P1FQT3_ASPOF|nr:uncharacterized protein A4U43_C01F20350 [Asparagus officinalis]